MSAKNQFKRKARTARGGPRFSSGRPTTIRKFNAARPVATTRRSAANIRTAGFLGIEHKFYDTFLANANIVNSTGATGGVHDPSASIVISAPAQGSKAINRDGKRIVIESIQIQGNIRIPERIAIANLDAHPTFFIALIEDHQSNAASMTSEEAFSNPSGNVFLSSDPFKNLLRSSRFTTHKVWKIQAPMPATASFGGANSFDIMGQYIPFDMFKKVNITVNFNGETAAGIASVVDNSLHLVCWVNDGSWAPKLDYNARIRFVG